LSYCDCGRFGELEGRCEQRGAVLDGIVTRLTELQSGVRQIDTWISATNNALKHDHNSLKNRAEGLYYNYYYYYWCYYYYDQYFTGAYIKFMRV